MKKAIDETEEMTTALPVCPHCGKAPRVERGRGQNQDEVQIGCPAEFQCYTGDESWCVEQWRLFATPKDFSRGVEVPDGLGLGQTFTQNGRKYVVIEDRSPIASPEEPARGLKAVEIAEDIALDEIVASPYNRKHFDEVRLNEMADSLRKNGQMETAVVRLLPLGHPTGNALKYELVAGERRWRGCKIAGFPYLRCHVRELSDAEAAEQLLLSNLEREDLTPIEEAETYQKLLELKDGEGQALYSFERIAERVFGDAKKKDRVAKTLKLLNLPKDMRKALDAGEVGLHVAFLVGRLADPKSREAAAKEILKPQYRTEPLSFRDADRLVSEKYQVSLKGAPFDLSDAVLVEAKLDDAGARIQGGACKDCPHLAKNNPAFEIATGGGDKSKAGAGGKTGVDAMTCTNPACYESKLEALWQRTATEIQKKEPGIEIVPRKKAEKWFSRYNDGLDYNAPVVLLASQVLPYSNEKRVTWATVLKGSGVPIMLACNPKGVPVKLADKSRAHAAAKISHPDLFKDERRGSEEVTLNKTEMEKLKKESEASGTTLVALVEKAQKAKAADAKRKEELARKIESEARIDSLKELQAAMTKKGVGIEALQIVWEKIVEESYTDDLPRYLGIEEDPNKPGVELESYPEKNHMTTAQLLPLLIVATLIEDAGYSGVENARGFKELAKIYNVSHKDVLARVKKAHELAEKQRVAADAAKEKEANKKPHKNSSDPNDWTPEKEAAKTAAADARAKEGGEELHTCTECGQGNFTAKGLKTHNCAKRVAAKKTAAKPKPKTAKSPAKKKAKGKK